MAIIKSIPARKIINGFVVDTSDISIVSELDYRTNGESTLIVRAVPRSYITLDSKTTDHITIKSMTTTYLRPDVGKIDEEYEEIELSQFSSIELRYTGGHWYILSSDGLKQS